MMDFGETAMSKADVDTFLTPVTGSRDEALKIAVATLRKDGTPFVVPLGFWYDGEYIYITMSPTRGGTARLRRNPKVSATVFLSSSPAKFFTIAGEAEEIADPDNEISKKIYFRYHGPAGFDYGPEFLTNWLAPGKVVFRIPMKNWVGMDMSKAANIADVAQTAADKAFLATRGADAPGS